MTRKCYYKHIMPVGSWLSQIKWFQFMLTILKFRCVRHVLPNAPPACVLAQHINNHGIRERTKQPTASSLLQQCRLRWFGHLHRMPSSLPVRLQYNNSWLEKTKRSPKNEMGRFRQARPQFCWPQHHRCCQYGLWPRSMTDPIGRLSGLTTLEPEKVSQYWNLAVFWLHMQ